MKNLRAPLNNSSRLIIHVDMDCYFASVPLLKRPDLQNRPVVISHSSAAGYSDVSACNYPARALGISNGMSMLRAKSLCPDLCVLPYDFDGYERVSQAIFRLFYSLPMLIRVQPVSVDEAYLEFPSNLNGLAVAKYIREQIFEVTGGCPSSAGVSYNILLARLATKKAKPNGQYEIKEGDVMKLLEHMKLSDMPTVGWSTAAVLREHHMSTCSDVWRSSVTALQVYCCVSQ